MNPIRTISAVVLPIAVAVAFAGCGSGVDQDKADAVRKQGTELQEQGARVQGDAAKLAADVQAGRITQAEADRRLEEQTTQITEKAKGVATEAIDVAKDANIPDEAKKALEDAQKQLQTAP